jgi:Kef-type K+ transport system membrane component KefB
MSYRFLLDLALILLSTKIFGLLTQKIQMPQVVGSLLAGLLLGPAVLNLLSETEFITQVSELGVVVILFTAGVGTDIRELRQSGKAGFLVALCGVLVPLGMGMLTAWIAFKTGMTSEGSFLNNLFVGTILTATSVSITVETLREMGKLNTQVGETILAAALIDDVLGLIALTLVSSMAGQKQSIALVLVKIAAFFLLAFAVAWLVVRFFNWVVRRRGDRNLRRYPILAFALCLLMAYCAEHFFGVADIIGAYAAGLMVSCTSKAKYIESKFEPLSYLLLTPVFFASVGISADISDMDGKILLFSVLLLVVAIVSKIIGCGLGARLCHFKRQESLEIGVGMASRGEVALIVANRAEEMGVLHQSMMTPVIVMVVGCAILTPVMLKLVYRREDHTPLAQSPLVESYGKTEELDRVSAQLLQEDSAPDQSDVKTQK